MALHSDEMACFWLPALQQCHLCIPMFADLELISCPQHGKLQNLSIQGLGMGVERGEIGFRNEQVLF
jgi:hypothetical protein